MTTEHVVRSYDEELQRLNGIVNEMGTLAEAQIKAALRVVERRDAGLADTVLARDAKIDGLEDSVDSFTVRMLALRQPVANDLRNIVAALRISIDLERIADYAASVVRRAMEVEQAIPERVAENLAHMGDILLAMLSDSLTAYRERDDARAVEVWKRDDEVDRLHLKLLQMLRGLMLEDPSYIQSGTHMLFICKNLERVGDHLTNVCEHVHYLVTGRTLRRPGFGGAARSTVIPFPAPEDGKAP
jgi:phosphate transport system protein